MSDVSTQHIGPLQHVNPVLLTTMVRRVVGSDTLTIDDWNVQSLTAGAPLINPGNGGIFRLAGTATDRSTTIPWSLVVKVLKNPAGIFLPNGFVISAEMVEDPANFSYWKREIDVLEAGVLDDLPANLHVPRYFGRSEQPGQGVWLWMEEIVDTSERQWPLERFGVVARQLGQFNGAYLTERALPSGAWVTNGWLRSWVTTGMATLADSLCEPAAWSHPHLRAAFPQPVREQLVELWHDHEALLDALDRLPRTFCHLDMHRANLLVQRRFDGQEQTIVIDWSLAGVAGVGEELTGLIVASVLLGHVARAEVVRLEQVAYDQYLAGLSDAGWHGDPRLVRFGYTASAALRFSFLVAAAIVQAAGDRGHEVGTAQEDASAAIQAEQAAPTYFLLDRAAEARALVRVLADLA